MCSCLTRPHTLPVFVLPIKTAPGKFFESENEPGLGPTTSPFVYEPLANSASTGLSEEQQTPILPFVTAA